jgi:NAD(P)-binding Rossmann-like domain
MNGQPNQNGTLNVNSVTPSSEEGGTFRVKNTNQNAIHSASVHARNSYMEEITVPFNDVPAFTPTKKLKVAIIGAGYSGLIMAHNLMYQHVKETERILDFTIFEAKAVPGGTWVDNTYPGGKFKSTKTAIRKLLMVAVMCDVPSALYVCY